MIQQFRLPGLWLGGLALVLVGLLGVLSFAQDARAAGDYSVSLQTPDQIKPAAAAAVASLERLSLMRSAILRPESPSPAPASAKSFGR